jgi:hypothetical protein
MKEKLMFPYSKVMVAPERYPVNSSVFVYKDNKLLSDSNPPSNEGDKWLATFAKNMYMNIATEKYTKGGNNEELDNVIKEMCHNVVYMVSRFVYFIEAPEIAENDLYEKVKTIKETEYSKLNVVLYEHIFGILISDKIVETAKKTASSILLNLHEVRKDQIDIITSYNVKETSNELLQHLSLQAKNDVREFGLNEVFSEFYNKWNLHEWAPYKKREMFLEEEPNRNIPMFVKNDNGSIKVEYKTNLEEVYATYADAIQTKPSGGGTAFHGGNQMTLNNATRKDLMEQFQFEFAVSCLYMTKLLLATKTNSRGFSVYSQYVTRGTINYYLQLLNGIQSELVAGIVETDQMMQYFHTIKAWIFLYAKLFGVIRDNMTDTQVISFENLNKQLLEGFGDDANLVKSYSSLFDNFQLTIKPYLDMYKKMRPSTNVRVFCRINDNYSFVDAATEFVNLSVTNKIEQEKGENKIKEGDVRNFMKEKATLHAEGNKLLIKNPKCNQQSEVIFHNVFDSSIPIEGMTGYLPITAALNNLEGAIMYTFGYSGVGKSMTLFGDGKSTSGMLGSIFRGISDVSNCKLRVYEMYGMGLPTLSTFFNTFIGYELSYNKKTGSVTLGNVLFNEEKPYVDIGGVDNLRNLNFNELTKEIENKRRVNVALDSYGGMVTQRIRSTSNNPDSSRSILVYEFLFTKQFGKKEIHVPFVVVDMPGKELLRDTYGDDVDILLSLSDADKLEKLYKRNPISYDDDVVMLKKVLEFCNKNGINYTSYFKERIGHLSEKGFIQKQNSKQSLGYTFPTKSNQDLVVGYLKPPEIMNDESIKGFLYLVGFIKYQQDSLKGKQVDSTLITTTVKPEKSKNPTFYTMTYNVDNKKKQEMKIYVNTEKSVGMVINLSKPNVPGWTLGGDVHVDTTKIEKFHDDGGELYRFVSYISKQLVEKQKKELIPSLLVTLNKNLLSAMEGLYINENINGVMEHMLKSVLNQRNTPIKKMEVNNYNESMLFEKDVNKLVISPLFSLYENVHLQAPLGNYYVYFVVSNLTSNEKMKNALKNAKLITGKPRFRQLSGNNSKRPKEETTKESVSEYDPTRYHDYMCNSQIRMLSDFGGILKQLVQ